MITVTVKDLLDFAKTKNPEDEVHMGQNYSIAKCGCLMVQYGREKFPELTNFGCGLNSWECLYHTGTDKTFAILENYILIWDIGFDITSVYEYREVVEILKNYLENQKKYCSNQ